MDRSSLSILDQSNVLLDSSDDKGTVRGKLPSAPGPDAVVPVPVVPLTSTRKDLSPVLEEMAKLVGSEKVI